MIISNSFNYQWFLSLKKLRKKQIFIFFICFSPHNLFHQIHKIQIKTPSLSVSNQNLENVNPNNHMWQASPIFFNENEKKGLTSKYFKK